MNSGREGETGNQECKHPHEGWGTVPAWVGLGGWEDVDRSGIQIKNWFVQRWLPLSIFGIVYGKGSLVIFPVLDLQVHFNSKEKYREIKLFGAMGNHKYFHSVEVQSWWCWELGDFGNKLELRAVVESLLTTEECMTVYARWVVKKPFE